MKVLSDIVESIAAVLIVALTFIFVASPLIFLAFLVWLVAR